MTVEVFEESLSRKYFADYLSVAHLWSLAALVLAIVIPFIIANNGNGLWVEEKYYYEIPSIIFSSHQDLYLYGSENDNYRSWFASTESLASSLFIQSYKHATFTSISVDENSDGVIDRIESSVFVPLQDHEKVLSGSIVAFVDYSISEKTQLKSDAAIILPFSFGIPSQGAVYIDCDLIFRQNAPLSLEYGLSYYSKSNYHQDVQAAEHSLSSSGINIPSLIRAQKSRIATMETANCATVSMPIMSDIIDSSFSFLNITSVYRMNPQMIRYSPTISEILADAWVTYVAFFVLTAFILNKLTSFVFNHKLIWTKKV